MSRIITTWMYFLIFLSLKFIGCRSLWIRFFIKKVPMREWKGTSKLGSSTSHTNPLKPKLSFIALELGTPVLSTLIIENFTK